MSKYGLQLQEIRAELNSQINQNNEYLELIEELQLQNRQLRETGLGKLPDIECYDQEI